MGFQGRYYRVFKWLARHFSRKVKVPDSSRMPSPAVYVCHHQNMRGPMATMIWLPVPVHSWSLALFFDRRQLREHFTRYTFGERFGWPKPLAAAAGWICSGPVSAMIKSMGAIRVHRNANPALARKTFQESLDALLRGENLIIYPDVRYDSDDDQIGEMYRGFLLLERAYHQKTDQHLPFVPLYYAPRSHEIRMSEPICFPDGDFRENMDSIYRAIREEINRLAFQSSEHPSTPLLR